MDSASIKQQYESTFQPIPSSGPLRGESASSVAIDEGSLLEAKPISSMQECGVISLEDIADMNEARPVGRGSGRKFRPSMFSMLALAAGASLEPMTLREAIHGIDEAEPPKPKTPRVSCWGYRGAQQYFVNEQGEAIPVRLSDPAGNLKERRKLLKQKRRSR